MEKKREMLHYFCRRQNEPRQPPSSFLSSSSSPPSLAAMHSTSNPGCNRRCSRGKSSEKTIRATVLLSLPPLPLALTFPRGEEEFFQRTASNLSRDCFVPFLPSVHPLSVQCLAMPSIVYADPLAFLAGGCTDVYI